MQRFAAGCLAVLLSGLPVSTQEGGSRRAAPEAAASRPPGPQLVTLRFPGGTYADLITAIRGVVPEVNIVASRDTADVAVPPIELTNATVLNALQAAASIVSGPTLRVDVEIVGRAPGVTQAHPTQQPSGADNLVHAVIVQQATPGPRGTAGAGSRGTDPVDVFSLATIVQPPPGIGADPTLQLTPEVVMTAIDTALSLLQQGGEPTIRYHEDSRLLFVLGTPEARDAVRQVLVTLEGDLGRRRSQFQRVPPAEKPPAEREDKR